MRCLGVIPARYASTRFPGKPLALLEGRPIIRHVVERCRQASRLSEVIVATEDERIAEAVRPWAKVVMTRPDHPSGTDRVAEVAAQEACDGVVNVQGDEPLIDPEAIDAVAAALTDAEMTTAATPLAAPEDLENPNVVKVVVNQAGEALYFSRWAVPYLRDKAGAPPAERLAAFPFLHHLGLYGYRRETLLKLVRLPMSPLEKAERLEQLRALENGIRIRVVPVAHGSVGIDTPADLARVEAWLAGGPNPLTRTNHAD